MEPKVNFPKFNFNYFTNPLKVGAKNGSEQATGVVGKAQGENHGWGNVVDRISQINCEVVPKAACRYNGGDGRFDMYM